MTASEVLALVLAEGGRVIPDPDHPRLVVPEALEPLVREHRRELRQLLLERGASGGPVGARHVAEALPFLSMPLTRFAQVGGALEIRVPWLSVTLWVVPDERAVGALAREGISRGRVWTAAELIDLMTLDDRAPDRLRTITHAKLEFSGAVVEVRKSSP